ncbi:MAG: hypothetical protein ACP5MC_00115 [Candidatus Micrarchaeia archaeon]
MANANKGGDWQNAGTSLWLIGELGGGLVWFSKENIIGVYKELKDRVLKGEGVPSLLAFNGELLPKMPEYITRGGYSKTKPLAIRTLDLATVAMKPHLVRLTELLAKNKLDTKVVYVMGYSDIYNESSYHDLFVKEYNFNPAQIGRDLLAYSKKVDADATIIEKSKGLLNKELSNGKDGKSHEEKIYNLREKVRQLEEERADYAHTYELLRQLFSLWLEEHFNSIDDLAKIRSKLNPGKSPLLDELISNFVTDTVSVEEVQKKYDEVSKELISVDKSKEPKRYEELDSYSKELADMLKRISAKEISKQQEQAMRAVHEHAEAGELYTHNLPGSKRLDDLSWLLADSIVKTYIRNTFGRRVNLDILSENVNDVSLKEIGVRLSARGSNTSESYPASPDARLETEAHFAGSNAEIVAMSHVVVGSVKAKPLFNSHDSEGKLVYEVSVPPIVDFQKVQEAWNEGIKTPLTEVVGKNKGVTSGFIEARISKDGGVSFYFYSSAYLKLKAKEAFDDEKEPLESRLKELKRSDQLKRISNSELSEESIAQIENKLPSEMNLRLLREAKERMPDSLAPYLASYSQPAQIKQLPILMYNDAHIGTSGYGLPTVRLTDALEKYLKDNGLVANILFLGGDNIEGDYLGIKNELNKESSISNVKEFEEYLAKTKIDRNRRQELVEEYESYLLYKQPIGNTDEQREVLIQHLLPVIKAAKAQAIVVVSGQHYNKSYRNKTNDEAMSIAQTLKGRVRAQIIPISGGDMGSGDVKLSDNTSIYVAHRLQTRRLNLDADHILALGADRHEHSIDFITTPWGQTVISATGTTSSMLTGFPMQVGIPTSQGTRGFTYLDLAYANDGTSGKPELLKAEIKLIGLKQLNRYTDLPKEILDFEKQKTRINIATTTKNKSR